MNICMVSSEALPFVKVGGLGDVVYSLSNKLAKKKINVSVVIPFYKKVLSKIEDKENIENLGTFPIKMSWRELEVTFYRYKYNKVNYYFICNGYYFGRDNIYGEQDDFERFAFFDLAAYELIFNYIKKVDIVHLHDWQASAVALLHHHNKTKKNENVKFMLTIHNPAFQGICQRNDLYQYFNLPESYFDEGLARLDDNVNLLKAAIMLSSKISTVSPTHKDELLRGVAAGGLEKVLPFRQDDFIGIINGVDVVEFNPSTDNLIYEKYNKTNVFKGKRLNKEAFAKEFGLAHPEYPTFAIVSRLTSQKGINFIVDNLDNLLKLKLNFVVLGQGEERFEKALVNACEGKDNAVILIKYSDALAHKIYASSDFLLMPSIFEPCGISQMIAMRYGTVPIAGKVGGLVDTITPFNQFNEETATGFLMGLSDESVLNNIWMALDVYSKRRIYNKLVHNCMNRDFSWDASCEKYIEAYNEILGK